MADNQKIEAHILSRFKVIKKLGSGAYGHVWKVTQSNQQSESLALKKVFEAFQHNTDAQRTYRQISILKKISHPNIIKLHEVLPSTSGRDVYLVFEYMTTDLYKTIYDNHLQDVHKKYIMYQLLKGLFYLHSAHVLHRDLKPSNLLLSTQCQLKICDFGLARYLGNDQRDNVLTQGVATRWYRAPEVLLGSSVYDSKADMWSVGCIFAEMLTKSPLFNCHSIASHFQRILQVVGRPSVAQLDQIGKVAVCLLNQCGQVRQKSPKEIFGSSCDESSLDLVTKLLKFDPRKRLSAKEALKHPYFRQFYRQSQLVTFEGSITLETDDNIKLSTDAYKELIQKFFIRPKERPASSHKYPGESPHRFSDLKRQKSFGRIIEDIHSRKSSCDKENNPRKNNNNSLFEQLIKQRNCSSSKVSCTSTAKQSRTKSIENSNNHLKERNKQNFNANRAPNLQQFSNKQPGTFAALRKVTVNRFGK